MFYRVFATNDSQRVNYRGTFARKSCVTLLCLFYLISNTAISPSLNRGKNCRCANQVKTKSQCCCTNKSTTRKSTASKKNKPGSCCSTKKQTAPVCCSDQSKNESTTQTNAKHSQFSSLCGCGNSAKDGLYSASPRDLNPSPVLFTPDDLTIPLIIVDVVPVTLATAPDTPHPQQKS